VKEFVSTRGCCRAAVVAASGVRGGRWAAWSEALDVFRLARRLERHLTTLPTRRPSSRSCRLPRETVLRAALPQNRGSLR
jgi:hypothetical protein